ncbi:hypothetical protein [Plantactinospora endophytica]|uniref:DUF2637 domain-containing protein n=1 Tax=Plantactinospora endophytica TaxID=673535 RepID=A0ABQ4E0B1_9ACTN|nr:hypothetical protein [Plantactinospora endophytica]GIG88107.1 hypothetical protein Pen02_30430 [Plantactinospora endophytica]
MTAELWAPAGASGIAAVISVINLTTARKKMPSWHALHWVVLRIAVDALASLAVYHLLATQLPDVDWLPLMLVAGLSGPALLRTQISFMANDQRLTHYGPASVYGRLQKALDAAIDDVSSTQQSQWLSNSALPLIERLELDRIRTRVEHYLKGLDRLTEAQQSRELRYLHDVVNDNTDHRSKCRTIVQRLLDTGGRRLVRSLMREGARASEGSEVVPAPVLTSDAGSPAGHAESGI